MTGLRFRETMSGRVTLRADDPVAGYESVSAYAAFMHAEIEMDDVAVVRSGGTREARLRAELVIPVLGGRFVSHDGTFVLFSRGSGLDGRPAREMVYTATFLNDDRIFKVSARKILQPGLRMWRDTTTAYVTLRDVTDDADGTRPRTAAGVIRISPWSFLVQLTTMQGFGAHARWSVCRWAAHLRAVLTYAAFFIGELVKIYLRRSV